MLQGTCARDFNFSLIGRVTRRPPPSGVGWVRKPEGVSGGAYYLNVGCGRVKRANVPIEGG